MLIVRKDCFYSAILDPTIKKKAQKIASQMGLNLSMLISALLTKVVNEKRVELTALTENGFSPEFEQQVLAAMKTKEGDVATKTPEQSEEFLNSLMN